MPLIPYTCSYNRTCNHMCVHDKYTLDICIGLIFPFHSYAHAITCKQFICLFSNVSSLCKVSRLMLELYIIHIAMHELSSVYIAM